jgi:hypothetical protein
MGILERAMTSAIEYPEMRLEVIGALRSLSDPMHQRSSWGRVEEGVSYYDDLTLNVHILYDDCRVLPSPETAVPSLLYEAEVSALRAVDEALGPLLDELGDRADEDYIADPRWPAVVSAARMALTAMQACDEADR